MEKIVHVCRQRVKSEFFLPDKESKYDDCKRFFAVGLCVGSFKSAVLISVRKFRCSISANLASRSFK